MFSRGTNKLGFEVLPIDLSTLYRDGGSLRCFANITLRLPDTDPVSPQFAHAASEVQIHRPGPWALQRISRPYPPSSLPGGRSRSE